MLYASVIQPSQNDFSSPIVMFEKNKGSWNMCPYNREFNNMIIKHKLRIPIIDVLLD